MLKIDVHNVYLPIYFFTGIHSVLLEKLDVGGLDLAKKDQLKRCWSLLMSVLDGEHRFLILLRLVPPLWGVWHIKIVFFSCFLCGISTVL